MTRPELATLLIAQESTQQGPSYQDILGPYGALALAIVVIVTLARAYTKQLEINRTLSDRLVEQAERSIPILTKILDRLERLEAKQ